MIVIAHLSDVHIGATAESAGRCDAVMRYLDALPGDLDAVLVTGDIADHGLPAEYEAAAKLLTSRHPIVIGPGNHDRRPEFRRFLLGEEPAGGPAEGPVNQVLHTGRAVYAMCDSSIPGRDDGHLDDETLDWLEGVLDGADQPVFVAFHHPPVTLQSPPIDAIRLHETGRLERLLAGRAGVPAVLVGHSHMAAATTFAGRPLLVGGGVVSTLKLPWEGAVSFATGISYDQPPMLAFHVLDDDGRLTTHYRVVA
ncbi:3',5'-cyclic AMP phosphodiesterase CpdA [Nonomuraea fuscirosea]|uniref:3',5'-cyclic AMP phosphodiesterase CpdA n=1 Tax=Nonomuraea fuscirosea TaxID=1291556 RepID=A0A2T0MDU5_9ACTN|nr:metallophosphoesterase [Nonomuraea fuscirosea]PRX55673.1 3',5'-cyclic AMP phosphodiesterase CpdA [Nonomuraea fuscirosea]